MQDVFKPNSIGIAFEKLLLVTLLQLKKVVFFYKTIPNAKVEKAEVELWGLK